MKKVAIWLCIIMLSVSLSSCSKEDTEAPNINNVTPLEAIGNQEVRVNPYCDALWKEGNWIYTTGGLSENANSIIKFQLDAPENIEVIHTMHIDEESSIDSVSALNGWVFFVLKSNSETSILYKIKEDGTRLTMLLRTSSDAGVPYILTNQGIFYQKGSHLYVMNFNGSHSGKVMEAPGYLAGIDNGWIYYTTDSVLKGDLYRVQPDGTKSEKVLDLTDIYEFVVCKDQIYFAQDDDTKSGKGTETSLCMKSIHGKTFVLETGSSADFFELNVAGGWVYFSKNEKVYRIKATGKGEKELFYRFPKENLHLDLPVMDSILVYDEDVLITGDSMSVYVKEDGTITTLPGDLDLNQMDLSERKK